MDVSRIFELFIVGLVAGVASGATIAGVWYWRLRSMQDWPSTVKTALIQAPQLMDKGVVLLRGLSDVIDMLMVSQSKSVKKVIERLSPDGSRKDGV